MAEAGAAKKLINQPDNVVDEAIDGLLLTNVLGCDDLRATQSLSGREA